jgi:hypothetical protein
MGKGNIPPPPKHPHDRDHVEPYEPYVEEEPPPPPAPEES